MPGATGFATSYVTAESLDQELERWLEETAPYRFRPVTPPGPSTALLVVDMTRPFVDDGRQLSSPNARVILPRVAALAEGFRAGGLPVLWLVQGHHSVPHDRGKLLASWWPTPILDGTPDTELAEGLAAAPGEKVIVKRRYSGFHQTDLDLTLRCLGIESVVICGVLTNVCPFATAMDAFEHGYRVYYPADATAALNRDLHVGALRTVAGWLGHVVRSRDVLEWASPPESSAPGASSRHPSGTRSG